MMISEFIERTGFEPTANEYVKIEEAFLSQLVIHSDLLSDSNKKSGVAKATPLYGIKFKWFCFHGIISAIPFAALAAFRTREFSFRYSNPRKVILGELTDTKASPSPFRDMQDTVDRLEVVHDYCSLSLVYQAIMAR